MSTENSNTSEPPDDPDAYIEVDPTGRYGRYDVLLGKGSVKKVYQAFDQQQATEVAWNKVNLSQLLNDPFLADHIVAEIKLLSQLSNKYIIEFYSVWQDAKRGTLNFITEICHSGNLREYRRKHCRVNVLAVKRWARQVLEGLEYLHTHEPCIIHRDINCSNIFVNGNTGQVKIGDFGLAAAVGRSHRAKSVLGTPEFMAPEMYEEDYNEMVDIYSFGMCVLEMVTREIPYSECDSIVKIYKNVTSGVMPQALSKVTDPEVKAFIVRAVGQPRARPSASELLKDPFFDDIDKRV